MVFKYGYVSSCDEDFCSHQLTETRFTLPELIVKVIFKRQSTQSYKTLYSSSRIIGGGGVLQLPFGFFAVLYLCSLIL